MLKPLDLVVLAGLIVVPKPTTQAQLASRLGISQASVHRAFKQLRRSGLLHIERPDGSAMRRLLQYAIRNVYPPALGPMTRGVSTAYVRRTPWEQAPDRRGWVWPDEDGDAYGPSVAPLHPCVPRAARAWPEFHDLMALIDTLRVGRARERKQALDLVDEILEAAQ